MGTPPVTSDRREEHRRMVETNLLGAMTVTEVFLDQLRDGGGDLVKRLLGRRSCRAGRLRRQRGDQLGDQRVVGGPARRAGARHPRDGHRAWRHRD
jgi:NAD(P)-dependent dehydrogenase (short-subunit alcohol dehydrogenase family)